MLFDEPLSNLDTQLRNEMRDELGTLFDQVETTVLYVTHDFSEALALADTILILEHGRAVQIATPQQVFTEPANPWAANLAGFTVALQPEDVRYAASTVQIQLGGTWVDATAAGDGLADASSDVTVVIRPEGVRLDAGGELSGTVVSSTYEGRRWRNRIDHGTGVVVAFSDSKLQPGRSVTFSIRPDAALVFARTPALAAANHSPSGGL